MIYPEFGPQSNKHLDFRGHLEALGGMSLLNSSHLTSRYRGNQGNLTLLQRSTCLI